MDSSDGESRTSRGKAQRDGTTLTNRQHMLWATVEQRPKEKTALVDGEHRLTYGDLGDIVRRIIAGLMLRWRVNVNTVIAVLAPNCAEFVASYLAITATGAVVQPIDERATAEEIGSAIADS